MRSHKGRRGLGSSIPGPWGSSLVLDPCPWGSHPSPILYPHPWGSPFILDPFCVASVFWMLPAPPTSVPGLLCPSLIPCFSLCSRLFQWFSRTGTHCGTRHHGRPGSGIAGLFSHEDREPSPDRSSPAAEDQIQYTVVTGARADQPRMDGDVAVTYAVVGKGRFQMRDTRTAP
ncbi:unnamed protein product [Lepidochelys kempii]